jgi:phage-related protein
MGILDSIGDFFSKIFEKILEVIKKIIKALLPLLIIIAVIYLAPYVATYLTTIGAPAWLSGAFSAIGSLAPYITSAAQAVGTWIGSVGSSAWTAFKSLEFSTQAQLVTGAAALIAPEETAAILADGVELAGDAFSTIAGGLLDGAGSLIGSALSSPIGIAAIGIGIWYFFIRDKGESSDANTE